MGLAAEIPIPAQCAQATLHRPQMARCAILILFRDFEAGSSSRQDPANPMPSNTIDRTAKDIVFTVQEYSLFAWRALVNLFTPPRYWPDFLVQADIVGVGSAAIVLLSGFFTGGVLALQSSATLAQFGATAVTGRFVSITMIRELGPVLTGIMVAGRNASSMASELGSMVVTEQIDAMRALGVDPMRKLVTPRIASTIIMLMFLTIVADACGIFGGAAVTVFMNGQDATQYFSEAYEFLHYPDIIQGMVKPLFSGYIIASIGCFYGMRTTGGTEGVGRSTIQAVVTASVLIIFVDFLLTQIHHTLFPPL
jgi:phospholipid/cholesterol/gamma-HCH transport system permease protein